MKQLLLLICCLFFQAEFVNANIGEDVDDSTFFITGKYSGTSISPNGRYLVQVEDQLDNYRLRVSDLESSEVIYNPKVGRSYPRNLVWLSNRRLMYQQGGRLIAMNIDGKEHRVIFKNHKDTERHAHSWAWYKNHYRGWSVLHTLPDDPDAIIIQSIDAKGIASVYKTNIFTGEKVEIINGKKKGVGSWQVDQEGRVVSGVMRKNGKIKVYFVEDKVYEVKKGKEAPAGAPLLQVSKSAPSFSSSGKQYLDSNFSVIGGSFEPGVIYVSEAMNRDTFQLSKYDTHEGRITEVIYSDPDYDVGNKDDSPILHFDTEAKKLVGVSYLKSDTVSVWFDERFQKIQSILDEQYPKRTNIIMQWTADLSKILLRSSSSNSLNRYYVYYTEKNRIVRFSEETALDLANVPASTVVHYSSLDGTQHEGYLTLPPNSSSESPLPTVVIVHGGPWARYINDYNVCSAYFVSKGFAVLRVNFRGSIGFGSKYLNAGAKNLSELMLDDIADGAKWAIDKGYADPDRLYIMGVSYGGYAALMSTVRHPNLYAAAVSFAAPLDLLAQMKSYKVKKNYYAFDVWTSAVGNFKTDKKALRRASPIHNIDNMKVPFLIFHGEDDGIVSVKQAKQYKKSLAKAGKKNSVYILRDEGHGFDHTSNYLYYAEKSLRLFNQKSP